MGWYVERRCVIRGVRAPALDLLRGVAAEARRRFVQQPLGAEALHRRRDLPKNSAICWQLFSLLLFLSAD